MKITDLIAEWREMNYRPTLDELIEVEAEMVAAEKDAARYRWLRDDGDAGNHQIVIARMYWRQNGKDASPGFGEPYLKCEIADYDDTIDAAILKEKAA